MNLYDIPTHAKSPKIVNAIIEIPKGCSVKYEYNADYNVFEYDRSLDSAMVYPASYGFIPNTYCEDGDPLDVLVISQRPLMTGAFVQAKVLGVLDMTDGGKKDYKVLAVPVKYGKRYRNLQDVEPMFLEISKNFFLHYKDLQPGEGKVSCDKGWIDRADSYDIINSCVNK